MSLGALGLKLVHSARLLGVGVAAGVGRAPQVTAKRIDGAFRRRWRCKSLLKASGWTGRVVSCELNRSMTWDSGIKGVCDSELQRMRRAAAEALYTAKGGSLDLKLAMGGDKPGIAMPDPAYEAHSKPLRLWATAVRAALHHEPGASSSATLSKELFTQETQLRHALHPWARAHGPAAGVVCTLWRLRSTALSASRFLTDLKEPIDLEEVSVPFLVRVVNDSVGRWITRRIAEQTSRPDLAQGIWWQP